MRVLSANLYASTLPVSPSHTSIRDQGMTLYVRMEVVKGDVLDAHKVARARTGEEFIGTMGLVRDLSQ